MSDPTPADRAFPSDPEWLDLPLPVSLPEHVADAAQFADGVLNALAGERAYDQEAHHAPPPHWRQALLAHLAPEPSPTFVARTLAGLRLAGQQLAGQQREQMHRRQPAWTKRSRWLLPLAAVPLAGAAGIAWYLQLGSAPTPTTPPTTPRAASVAFAHHRLPSPLPELLVRREHQFDPEALPAAAASGFWLAEARR